MTSSGISAPTKSYSAKATTLIGRLNSAAKERDGNPRFFQLRAAPPGRVADATISTR